MKITFIWLRWTGDYGLISGYFARKSGGIVMPLNLTLLASIARKAGHEVSIIDAEIDRINFSFSSFILNAFFYRTLGIYIVSSS